MKKFIELPWGDVVNREHVAGTTIEREGVGVRVVVCMKTEGLQFLGPVHNIGAAAEEERDRVRDLLIGGSRVTRVPRHLRGSRVRDATSTSDDGRGPPDG
jgi:hypothetical protein